MIRPIKQSLDTYGLAMLRICRSHTDPCGGAKFRRYISFAEGLCYSCHVNAGFEGTLLLRCRECGFHDADNWIDTPTALTNRDNNFIIRSMCHSVKLLGGDKLQPSRQREGPYKQGLLCGYPTAGKRPLQTALRLSRHLAGRRDSLLEKRLPYSLTDTPLSYLHQIYTIWPSGYVEICSILSFTPELLQNKPSKKFKKLANWTKLQYNYTECRPIK